MNQLLDQALERLRELPQTDQDRAAESQQDFNRACLSAFIRGQSSREIS